MKTEGRFAKLANPLVVWTAARRSRGRELLGALLALQVLCGIGVADSNSVHLINATNGPIDKYIGTGIRIGQIELGVPNHNHVFLLNKVILRTNLVSGTSGAIDSHATEVAGVLVSTSATVRGVAPGATLYSVDVSTGTTDFDDVNAAYFLATQQNVRVINASYGIPSITNVFQGGTNFGVRFFNTLGTSVWERGWDRVVSETKVTIVKSAGNNGDAGDNTGAGATNSISLPGGAFNIIVVGAVSNVLAGTVSTNVADFSSRGYLLDARSKPDLVAPGVNVAMPTHPIGAGGTAVNTNDGTSFAAPHVAGVVARLMEAAASNFSGSAVADAQDPRVMKALLLNSATKLPGWSQVKTVSTGITNVVRVLDPHQGAGLLNAGEAYDQLVAGLQHATIQNAGGASPATNNFVGHTGWDLFTVDLSLTNLYRVAGPAAGELRLTLDWHRDVDSSPSYTVLGMANLDLYLWSSPDPGFTNLTLVARSISTVDNVEHLYFTNLPAAYYQFGVYYSNYFAAAGPSIGTITYGIAWDLQAIPEPSILLLLSAGAVFTQWWRGRKSRH